MKFLYTLLFTCLISFSGYGTSQATVDEVEQKLDVKIYLDANFNGTWKDDVDYKTITDTVRLNNYLNLLLSELIKYPKGYLKNVIIDTIIICDSLRYNSQFRAALPDPYKNTLYYSINPEYSNSYLKHVVHHELHHCTEFTLWGSMYYSWKKWNKCNKRSFKYGKGGAVAYKNGNKNINYSKKNHPKKGFVNLYSTLGGEEDRCEIAALIMYDEKKCLLKFSKKDRRLRRKIKLVVNVFNKVSNTSFVSWKDFKRAMRKI